MHDSLQLTSVHLRVADLARSLAYYTRQLGFVVVNSTPTHAELAVAPATPALLTLTGDPSARRRPRRPTPPASSTPPSCFPRAPLSPLGSPTPSPSA
jgi:catechol-2,3-dioxygenase